MEIFTYKGIADGKYVEGDIKISPFSESPIGEDDGPFDQKGGGSLPSWAPKVYLLNKIRNFFRL